jgi:hypothetical protein
MPVKVSHEMEIESRMEELLAKTGARDRVNISPSVMRTPIPGVRCSGVD